MTKIDICEIQIVCPWYQGFQVHHLIVLIMNLTALQVPHQKISITLVRLLGKSALHYFILFVKRFPFYFFSSFMFCMSDTGILQKMKKKKCHRLWMKSFRDSSVHLEFILWVLSGWTSIFFICFVRCEEKLIF